MSTQSANKTIWALDPMHSEVQFKVRHLVISTVTGNFRTFSGSIESEGENFEEAKIRFILDTASIDTNQEQRDGHLKSGDFFDVATYPHITFESSSFRHVNGSAYKLTGQLTVKDVTKTVELDVEFGGTAVDFYGNHKAGFDVTGKINRKEFNLTWDGITEAGAIVVGEEVKLLINVQFAQQK